MEVVAALEDVTDRALPDWLLIEHPTIRAVLQALAGDASGNVPGSTLASTSALMVFETSIDSMLLENSSVRSDCGRERPPG